MMPRPLILITGGIVHAHDLVESFKKKYDFEVGLGRDFQWSRADLGSARMAQNIPAKSCSMLYLRTVSHTFKV